MLFELQYIGSVLSPICLFVYLVYFLKLLFYFFFLFCFVFVQESKGIESASSNNSSSAGLFGGATFENQQAAHNAIHRNISTGSATELVNQESSQQALNDSLSLLQESTKTAAVAMAESKPPESKLM